MTYNVFCGTLNLAQSLHTEAAGCYHVIPANKSGRDSHFTKYFQPC